MALPTRVNHSTQMDPWEVAQRDFDTMLGRLFSGRQYDGAGLAPYGVDIREDADHFYVEAELPGFRKEDVNITLENQTLTISAERTEQSGEAKKDQPKPPGQLLLNERRYSKFLRSFTLPPTVDERMVDAKLNDGMLRITLNKREETKPRKITVS